MPTFTFVTVKRVQSVVDYIIEAESVEEAKSQWEQDMLYTKHDLEFDGEKVEYFEANAIEIIENKDEEENEQV